MGTFREKQRHFSGWFQTKVQNLLRVVFEKIVGVENGQRVREKIQFE